MVGKLATSRWFAVRWRRRTIIAAIVLVLGLFALFPRQYRAVVTLTPTDPASLGLGAALGQLGAFSSVFGNQAAIEIALKVARSQDVRRGVMKRLDLIKREDFSSERDADLWLQREVDVRALRGGIIQIEMKNRDAPLARAIVGGYSDAMRQRLSEIGRTQTAYKRQILTELVASAGDRYAQAQRAYDVFRRRTRYAEPGTAIGAIGARIPNIEAGLKGLDVQIQAARAFATDDNLAVRQLLAQRQALVSQLNEARSLNATEPNSVNRVVEESTQVQRLERELGIARGLYESYMRFLDGTSVEDLTSMGNVRILEPPFVETRRQLNTLPAGLALLALMIGLATEFYLLRPPLEAVRRREAEVW